MISIKSLRYAAICATFLAFIVVMLGAYTRLTDAGLGCPDWPGCYGQLVLPSAKNALEHAQNQYPLIPIEARKAWTEMIHRYAAGTLALLIIFIAAGSLSLRRRNPAQPWVIPAVLLGLVAFQAALGMWTVTLKLLPVVVMGHLLGGLLILTCLSYFCWQLSGLVVPENLRSWLWWCNLGLLIVFCQIALGGWVSSNYAGISCIGFPTCNGIWIPQLHLKEAFNLFSGIGTNYQGGVLSQEARVTIQFVHRVGAFITAAYILSLSAFILGFVKTRVLRRIATLAIVLILVQFGLGVINVMYLLPLWAAVAHNAVAGLLLASMASMCYLISKGASHASK